MYRDIDFANATANQIDRFAVECGGVVATAKRYVNSLINELPENTILPGGWRVVHRPIFNSDLVEIGIRATDRRTRLLARKGKVAQWVKQHGIREDTAHAIYSEQVRWKHELVALIPKIEADEGLLLALLDHPNQYGIGSGRRGWLVRWNLEEKGFLGLSAPRETELAKLAKALRGQGLI